MSHELAKKYRPRNFKTVVGQADVVRSIQSKIRHNSYPHFSLFLGPSGTGKTTLARIVANKLGCGEADLSETNAASDTGVDNVRSIESRMGLAPMEGKVRFWIIDEAHMLTTAAQNCFLKRLEEPPAHVYFIFCTTHPNKLLPTVMTRAHKFTLTAVSNKDMEKLLAYVCEKEGLSIGEECIEKIIEYSSGSPRQALTFLDQVMHAETDDERLGMLCKVTGEQEGIALARVLFKKGVTWPEVQKILNTIKEDPEQIRWMVLSYAKSILRGQAKALWPRAAQVIELFQDNFYDSKDAGLTLACYGCVS